MDGNEGLSDGQLLAAARAGDRHAFAALVDRYKDPLVSFLTRLTGRPDAADDLAQESFVRLYERAGAYREQGRLKAYLFRIAMNLLRSSERQRRRRELLRAAFLPTNGHRTPAPQSARLLQSELRDKLARAIAELPLRYRTPFVLREVEGWSYRQICDAIGCREGTVKSRIHRGRRMLRERLTPYLEGGAP